MISNYTVTGMTCGNCAHHVTEEVQGIDGVTGVHVDHISGQMTIESDQRIPFDAVIEAVAEAGDYSVNEA